MTNPYKVTTNALEEIQEHCKEKIRETFPEGIPLSIEALLSHEKVALKTTSHTYALLIAYDIIKELRYHRFDASLTGDWIASYTAWLMDITEETDPIQLSEYYREMGFELIDFIQDECYKSPVEIQVESDLGKMLCIELLKKYAHEREFWLHEFKKGQYRLILDGFGEDDAFANYAPIIQIVK